MVSAPFCCLLYINDARNLPVNTSTDMVERSPQRKDNVSFLRLFFPKNQLELQLYDVGAIKALRCIDKEENLCLRYGRQYTYSSLNQVAKVSQYLYDLKENDSFIYHHYSFIT